MKIRYSMTVCFIFLAVANLRAQQKVISLKATGSESWTWTEQENLQEKAVYNVSRPTLTVFLPDSAVSLGTAVVICPGGGFQMLSIDNEGYDVAKWLNKMGIAAFVLKYRLAHTLSDNPFKEFIAKKPNTVQFNEGIRPIVAMALADGENAISFVRSHCAQYHIASERIGILGFSAGGTVATAVAYNYAPESRPDFVGAVYPYFGSFAKDSIPKDAPPLFIVVASDDQFGFNAGCLDLYKEWTLSKHVAELHIYAKGGHGFGMRKQNLTSDTWTDRFGEWLKQLGYLTSK